MAKTLTLRLALTPVSGTRARSAAESADKNRGSNHANTERNADLLARCQILALKGNASCDAIDVTDLFVPAPGKTPPYYNARRVVNNQALSAYHGMYVPVTMRNVVNLSAAVVRGECITDSHDVRVYLVRAEALTK